MPRRYLNLTPRWSEMLPTILMMYRQAVEGDCTNPSLIKDNMRGELERCALAADRYSDLVRYLREVEGYGDEQLERVLGQGRALSEEARSTVHEEED